MGQVRPFREDDIPRIIELNTKLFPGSASLSPETQRFNFMEVCLHNPWYDEGVSSLVYIDNNKRVSGFIAIIPRIMVLNGRSLTVGMVQHLMVDPESRSPFASMELFKALMAGKQDISISDVSSDIGRKLWHKCGGRTAYAYSTYWKTPLRPLTFAASRLRKRKRIAHLANISIPAFRALDAVAARVPMSPLSRSAPDTVSKELTLQDLLENISFFSSGCTLRPQYDERSLGWLLDTLSREKRWGSLEKVAVYTRQQDLLGWYVYYLNRTGTSEVLQIGATENSIDRVLVHLYYDAWKHGASALGGRVNPVLMKAFTRNFSFVFPGQEWMLVHAKDPELLLPIFHADAWLTRLEGDLWML